MTTSKIKQAISIYNDPWEAYNDIKQFDQLTLSNVEFTTTNLCNMRCSHCAVGYTLQTKDPDPLPMNLIYQRLDEIPNLRTMSITGGEPMFSKKSINNVVKPLLKKQPPLKAKLKLYEQMLDNASTLSDQGMFVSAETMLNQNTLPHLENIHKEIVNDMKCSRHEVHPMYPADFASQLNVLSLKDMKQAIHHLLDIRDKNTWMLFGTLPIYPCINDENDQLLLERLRNEKNVTVRNDPDGRSRLNVNVFSGDVIVTDFGDENGTISNIKNDKLTDVFDAWLSTDLAKSLNCHCEAFQCLGPNVLVKNMYYPNTNFRENEIAMHTEHSFQ